jgi:hypothetical protein
MTDEPVLVPTCSPQRMRPVIAISTILGSFAIFALIGRGYCDLNWEKTIMLIVGALIANLTTIISWYFGSSEDSSKKTDILAMK